MKKEYLLLLIEKEISSNRVDKDRIILQNLKKSVENDTLSNDQKIEIIEFVLLPNLQFDDVGDPIGDTLLIEKMINFLNIDYSE